MKSKRRSRLEEYTTLYDMMLDIHHALEKLETKIKCLRIEERIRDEGKPRNYQGNKKGK